MDDCEWREVEVDHARDFFTKSRFVPFARQAYRYIVRNELDRDFFGGAVFAPELIFYPSEGEAKPMLAMSGENDEGVTLCVGAMEVQEELRGYCSVKQRYEGESFCIVDVFFKDGEAEIFLRAD